MFRKLLICAGCCLSVLTGFASGQGIVDTGNGEGLTDYFIQQGFRAELIKDPEGDPLVSVTTADRQFSVYFYDCYAPQKCQSIQFFAGYGQARSASLQSINNWNQNYRFIRAYLADDQSVRLEMDVFAGQNGLDQSRVSTLSQFWVANLETFETSMNW